jgi:hypothetical protein
VTGAPAILDWRGVVGALAMAAVALSGPQARAGGDAGGEPRLFLRLAIGPAANYESWSPSGGSPGASYTGWAPVLDAAVGRRVRRGLVIAGDLQLASVVNRTESYLGGSYPLGDTLHLVDTLGALVDYTPWSLPRLHVGGGVGLMAATDVDTHMGSTKTSWGWALSAHAGLHRRLARSWSIGLMARLTFYRFASDAPPPSATSVGLLPAVLVTFSR